MQFNALIGQEILILIPRLHQTQHKRVKLIGVDYGGIWIESQEIVNAMLASVGTPTSPKTPVFFVPYHEIAVASASIEGPALNEKAFGV